MEILPSDILAEVCTLSPGLLIGGLVVGLFLWLLGWWSHRFWVVLIMTVLAGVYGLYEAPEFRAQPLLASLLLALAAGMLALALVRVLAFTAGGLAGLWLIEVVGPSWNQPLLTFLIFGLIGILLFRLWVMALTSYAGTLLLASCGLAFYQQTSGTEVVAWAGSAEVVLNWICGLLALIGLIFQFLLDRRRQGKEKKSGKTSDKDRKEILLGLPLGWGLKLHRKAG